MKAVVAVAVLPAYRDFFLEEAVQRASAAGIDIDFCAGDAHIDPTVKTGSHPGLVRLANVGLMGRKLMYQRGISSAVRGADVVVVDLNPRMLSAWLILLRGRVLGVRTLVWGHILPRKGESAKTVPLRRAMRRLARGVISYTWTDAGRVRTEDPDVPVWVAANGLYPASDLGYADETPRDAILYVGRMEKAKKPELLLEAFALAADDLPAGTRLVFAGSGSELEPLRQRAEDLAVGDRVEFLGYVGTYDRLKALYESSLMSVSPGYVGLSLTQSLGFGVPMIVADDEPHAPEVELFDESCGRWFTADSATALATAMVSEAASPRRDRDLLVERVKRRYSSSAMADGFVDALRGRRSSDDG